MTPEVFSQIESNLTRALLTRDFDLYKTLFHLPNSVLPHGGDPYTLNTDDEMREDFELYTNALRVQRATDIYRQTTSVSQMEPDQIEVTVETNILGSTGRVVEPFHTQFVLGLRDGEWRIVQVRSSFGHLRWTRGLAKINTAGRFEDLTGHSGRQVDPAWEKNIDGDNND